MRLTPVKTTLYIKWLKSRGLVHISTRGSHWKFDIPNEPLDRPVIVRGSEKEVPKLHQITNMKTLGLSKSEYLAEIIDFK